MGWEALEQLSQGSCWITIMGLTILYFSPVKPATSFYKEVLLIKFFNHLYFLTWGKILT